MPCKGALASTVISSTRNGAKARGSRPRFALSLGPVAGAGAGIGIQEARRGTSTANVYNSDGSLAGRLEKRDNADYWKGALIGAAAGAVVCGVAGHYFLDPEQATPTPAPPPPPPPAPTPNPEALPAPSSKRMVLRGVNFDFDKSDIRPDSRPVLDEAADVLTQHPQIRVSVEGHTDSKGTDAYNEKLSVRRAEAVFRYLVGHGVTPERLEVIGYGETRPVADNETDAGRAQNRRVELHVVSPPEDNGGTPPLSPPPAPAAEPTPAPADKTN
ncbi:MAG: OmpA family protein [Deltaproteobacteria bacterium]|nr:OmpA family protein [Deltaproteobacteria bacterium]